MNKESLSWGVLGAVGIALIFYAVQALGMQSWSGPYYFFKKNWYFISPLVILFAVQVSLWGQMKWLAKMGGQSATPAGRPVAASGGVSTGAMLACCLHNFVALLPILGISGLAIFFAAYQNYIFLLSILFSGSGLIFMVYKYKKVKAHCEAMQKV